MKIIILGANSISLDIAKIFSNKQHDVILIDQENDFLNDATNNLDIACITGDICDTNVLYHADADDADILIALSTSDEKNILSCILGKNYFNIPKTIAYIKNIQLLSLSVTLKEKIKSIDHIINTDFEIINKIVFHISNINLYYTSLSFSHEVVLFKQNQEIETKTCDDKIIKLNIDQKDDASNLYLGFKENFEYLLEQPNMAANNNILLSGDNSFIEELSSTLSVKNKVKIISMSTQINVNNCNAPLIKKDWTKGQTLIEENISNIDIFCAIDQKHHYNITVGMLAKKLGAKKTIAIHGDKFYKDGFEKEIDLIISPHAIIVNKIKAITNLSSIHLITNLSNGYLYEILISKYTNNSTIQKYMNDLKFLACIKHDSIISLESNEHYDFFENPSEQEIFIAFSLNKISELGD